MINTLLLEIKILLEEICNKSTLPTLIYAKDIENNYKVNLNKATEFCQKYGTNFGGWCIEATKFREILHNANKDLFE